MRLILNKALDNINDNVNLKIIEITSTDFLNNDLDYFVYKYQIPLIKFTDTEEIFNINNFKIELSSSLSETELILTESDLELLSGGGGGTQDLQSVLDNGSIINNENSGITFIDSLDIDYNGQFTYINRYGTRVQYADEEGVYVYAIANQGSDLTITKKSTAGITVSSLFLKTNPNSNVINGNVLLPRMTGSNTEVTLATLDNIKKIDLSDRIYANNAAAISGGLTANDVYRTSTGELRIVV